MICGTFTLTKIPAAQVDEVMAEARATIPPPTSVASQPDGDGTFTVIATWPACADTVSHATDGA